MLLLHELTHTTYAMNGQQKALDYAYWVPDCLALALHKFDRSKAWYADPKFPPLCPNRDGKEGYCEPELSQSNADSIALIAAGIYFSAKCCANIPIIKAATLRTRREIYMWNGR